MHVAWTSEKCAELTLIKYHIILKHKEKNHRLVQIEGWKIMNGVYLRVKMHIKKWDQCKE